ADRAIVSQVVPGPGAQRADAVTKADQVIDVDEDPGQPAEKAGELQSAWEVGHAGVATDGRHGAVIDVVKWCAFALDAADGIGDRRRPVAARMLRGRGVHGQFGHTVERRSRRGGGSGYAR